jgi:Ca2+-binding RTX toxin-like protein
MFTVPEWALLANDAGPSNLDVAAIVTGGSGLGVLTHNLGTGSAGDFAVKETGTLGGSFEYQATDGSQPSEPATVTIQNQDGGDITGTAADEILVGGTSADKIDGGAGNDIIVGGGGKDEIFGGAGDDILAVFNIDQDKYHGGTDNVAASGGLAASAPNHGDVLVDTGNLFLADSARAANIDGIETISTEAKFGAVGSQDVTIGAASVQQLSDHTITPGGVFAEHEAIRIDGDLVDELYLSISKDGGQWVDTAIETAGYRIFAHETTAGDAASTDAYVMVKSDNASVGNVHLNQDAP